VSAHKLSKILVKPYLVIDDKFDNTKRRTKFKKIHNRARLKINEFIKNANEPI
jgi:hypothetical protein